MSEHSSLTHLGQRVGDLLKTSGHSIAVAESSTGGLLSASLLAVPGASAYFHGGTVIYTYQSRRLLFGLTRDDVRDLAPMSVEVGAVFARRVRERFGTTWSVCELGATGPSGTRYGHPAGTCIIAIDGPLTTQHALATGESDREANMWAFTRYALDRLADTIELAIEGDAHHADA